MISPKEFRKGLFANGALSLNLPPDFWITVLASLTNTCDITAEFVQSEEFAESFDEEDPDQLNFSVMGPFLARALLVEALVKYDMLEEAAIEDMGLETIMGMFHQDQMSPLQTKEIHC